MYRTAKALGTGAIVALIASAIVAQQAHANDDDSWRGSGNAAQATRTLINTTQGPLWPPSTVTDKDGNFVVVGSILTQTRPGVVTSVTGAALVSKDTVPPLDANGREDFSDPMAAPYKIL